MPDNMFDDDDEDEGLNDYIEVLKAVIGGLNLLADTPDGQLRQRGRDHAGRTTAGMGGREGSRPPKSGRTEPVPDDHRWVGTCSHSSGSLAGRASGTVT